MNIIFEYITSNEYLCYIFRQILYKCYDLQLVLKLEFKFKVAMEFYWKMQIIIYNNLQIDLEAKSRASL